jgi:hypothetical protein
MVLLDVRKCTQEGAAMPRKRVPDLACRRAPSAMECDAELDAGVPPLSTVRGF